MSQTKVPIGAPKIPISGIPIRIYDTIILMSAPNDMENMGRAGFPHACKTALPTVIKQDDTTDKPSTDKSGKADSIAVLSPQKISSSMGREKKVNPRDMGVDI